MPSIYPDDSSQGFGVIPRDPGADSQSADPWAGWSPAFVRWAQSMGYSPDDLAETDSAGTPYVYLQWLQENNRRATSGGLTADQSAQLGLEQQRLAMEKANAAATQQIERDRLAAEAAARTQTAQSSYVTDLMREAQSPDSFYRYLFNLYGETGPQGGNKPGQLPLTADQQAVTLNPTTGKPQGQLAAGIPTLQTPAGVTYGQQGATLTLPPYLQNLFKQTGQNVSTLALGPNGQQGGYASFGTPSAQTWSGLTPSEQGNAVDYAQTVSGVPNGSTSGGPTAGKGGDLESNIARLAPQGAGLEQPTAFARGGVMMPPPPPPLGTPGYYPGALSPITTPDSNPAPPPLGTPGYYPGALSPITTPDDALATHRSGQQFARGGLMMPRMAPPMPMGGVATQPTQGPAPNQMFGEAGPEAAVPLNSPGGPLAMQALQQNTRAGYQPDISQLFQPSQPPPNPLAMLNPTSREQGLYQTQALLPDDGDLPDASTPGQSGGHVAKLQRALERTGHLQLPPGINYGYHGPLTTSALARLQQELGHNGTPGHLTPDLARLLRQRLVGGAQGPQGPNPLLRRGA